MYIVFQHRALLRLCSVQPPRRSSAPLLSHVPPMVALHRHNVERATIGYQKSVQPWNVEECISAVLLQNLGIFICKLGH